MDLYLDLEPGNGSMMDDVLKGLSSTPKRLPSKYFYDEAGSALFDRITELDEYYLTRTETRILTANASEMAASLGPDPTVVEFGSGSSIKTTTLLDHLIGRATYIPIDISREHLIASAGRLKARYPRLIVLPVCADFSQVLDTRPLHVNGSRRTVFFPGSTIGNLTPDGAVGLLKRARDITGQGGGMLIGTDLQKDVDTLIAAYDDSDGVTARFNRNILRHINQKLGATFEPELFEHTVRYDGDHDRIEMWLTSTAHQQVTVGDKSFTIREGEGILTEYSHKYTFDGFAELARRAGYRVERVWTDERQWFSVQYLVAG